MLTGLDQALDAAGAMAERHRTFAEWRSARFYTQAERRFRALAVDGAIGIRYFVRPKIPTSGARSSVMVPSS